MCHAYWTVDTFEVRSEQLGRMMRMSIVSLRLVLQDQGTVCMWTAISTSDHVPYDYLTRLTKFTTLLARSDIQEAICHGSKLDVSDIPCPTGRSLLTLHFFLNDTSDTTSCVHA